MNQRPCIRCQHPVILEDGHLVYCSNCGAPQIFLSEELQAEIAQQTEEYNQRSTPQPTPEPGAEPPARGWRSARSHQPWPRAVQYALVSAGVAFGLGLLSLLFPPTSLLMLLWAVAAPVVTVAFFIPRSAAGAPTSSGFAAKLGLLTGMLVAFAGAAVSSLNLVIARFVQHDAAAIDAQIASMFAQQRTMLLQRMGTAAQPTLDMLNVPEFRVGLLLCVFATSACLYLAMSTLAAGLTGIVLRSRRPA